jgi:hypothetical protein
MGEMRYSCNTLVGNLRENDNLEDQDIYGSTILKLIFKLGYEDV